MATQFETGFLVGLLVGEGYFGGDGRQPQVTLRMHVRHEAIFRWLEKTFPGGRLYGPYNHDGRHYFQWLARGAFLRDQLVPLLDRSLSPDLDRHCYDRFQRMRVRYPQLAGAGTEREKPSAPCSDDIRNAPDLTRSAQSAWAGTRDDERPQPVPDPLEDLFAQLRAAWPPRGDSPPG